MLSLLWRFFPGPWWVRILVMLAVLALVVWVLIQFVYPWVAITLPSEDVTVTDG